MEDITLELLFVLMGVGFVAGFVDAIAGGGGLISIPALLWTGMMPIEALATNKLQGSFGTLTASLKYYHHGFLNLSRLAPAIALTLAGAVAGTVAVHRLPDGLLADLVPALLIAFALYFLLSPTPGDQDRQHRIHHHGFALLVGTTVGFYDGFFGPGTGSFFTLAFVMLLGYGLPRAVAGAKLLNFTSNFASLIAFALGGHILWLVGLTMGVGQIAGAYLGSHMAVRHGARLIKPLLVITAVAMSVKLLLEETGSPTVAG